MRILLLAAALAVAIPGHARSAPCLTDTLAGYIALGSGGCTIASASFHDFASLDLPFGALAIAPETIVVTPLVADPSQPGLQFAIDVAVGPEELREVLIGYQVTAPSLQAARLSIAGSSVTGDGAVTGVEDLCLAGSFAPGAPTDCTGTPDSLIVFDVGVEFDLLEEIGFAPVGSLAVVKDLAVDGGLEGTASLASAINQFVIPEPTTALLAGIGALGLALHRRPRRS